MAGAESDESGDGGESPETFDNAWSELVDAADAAANESEEIEKTNPKKKRGTKVWTEDVRGERKQGDAATAEPRAEADEERAPGTLNWSDDVRARPKLDFNPIAAFEATEPTEETTARRPSEPSSEFKSSSSASTSGVFDVVEPPPETQPESSEEGAREMERVMSEAAVADEVPKDDSIPPPSPAASGSGLPLMGPDPKRQKESAETEMEMLMVARASKSPAKLSAKEASPRPAKVKDPKPKAPEPTRSRAAEPTGSSSTPMWWAVIGLVAAVGIYIATRDDEPRSETPPTKMAQAEVVAPAKPSKSPTTSAPSKRPSAPPTKQPEPPPVATPPPSPEPGSPDAKAVPVPEASPEPGSPVDEPDPTADPTAGEPEPEPTPAETSIRRDPREPPAGTPPEIAAVFRKIPVSAADKPPVGGIGASGIHVDDIAMGSSYGRSRCQGPSTKFSAGTTDRINVCVRVVHPREREEVTVLWEQGGGTMRRSKVVIKNAHAYRTRAFLVLRSEYVGPWTVRILSKDGVELASHGFEVVE